MRVVEGIEAILARLSSLPASAQREVDEVAREVAGVEVAQIRRAARSAGRQATRAAESVHAEGSAVVGGGPFFMGSVFGGQGRPTTRQFKPYRPEAYWFFPTLIENQDDVVERFAGVVDVIAREWDAA